MYDHDITSGLYEGVMLKGSNLPTASSLVRKVSGKSPRHDEDLDSNRTDGSLKQSMKHVSHRGCPHQVLGCKETPRESLSQHYAHSWTNHLLATMALLQITSKRNSKYALVSTDRHTTLKDIKEVIVISNRSMQHCTEVLESISGFWCSLKPRIGKLNKTKYWFTALKEKMDEYGNIIGRVEESNYLKALANGNRTRNTVPVGSQIARLDRYISGFGQTTKGCKDLRNAIEFMETTSYDGHLVMKVDNFNLKFGEAISGKKLIVYGTPFHSHRYGFEVRPVLMLYGDKEDELSFGKYVALYIGFLTSAYDCQLTYPLEGSISMTLCSINDGSDYKKHTQFRLLSREGGHQLGVPYRLVGFPRFISHKLLHSNHYIENGAMYLRFQLSLKNSVSKAQSS